MAKDSGTGAPIAAMQPPKHALPDSTWADYASRSRLLWCLLGIGLLAVLALARVFLVDSFGWHGFFWPLILWAAAVIAAALHLQAFRCPRCQSRFFHRAPPLLALRGSRCVHCCLPKD